MRSKTRALMHHTAHTRATAQSSTHAPVPIPILGFWCGAGLFTRLLVVCRLSRVSAACCCLDAQPFRCFPLVAVDCFFGTMEGKSRGVFSPWTCRAQWLWRACRHPTVPFVPQNWKNSEDPYNLGKVLKELDSRIGRSVAL